jgi:hypothetical protein
MSFRMFSSAVLAGVLGVGAFASGVQPSRAADAPEQHLRGTVAHASPTSVTITLSGGGEEDVALVKSTILIGAVPASISDIKANEFLGVANVPHAGGPQAVGVFLLPDAFRVQSFNVAWDFPGSAGGSSMTNATASRGSSMTNATASTVSSMTNATASKVSSMTNATASKVSSTGPLTLTLTWAGGSKQVTIPANTPVVRIVPATWSALKPGAHVFAAVNSVNGHPTGQRVIVGEQGIVPPI